MTRVVLTQKQTFLDIFSPNISDLVVDAGGLKRRHETHTTTLTTIHASASHVSPQLIEDLAVPPASRHRPVGGFEVAHRLRPLSRGRLTCDLVALGLRIDVGGRWRVGRRRVRG